VQAAAVVHDSAERRALSPSRARSPSPVRDGSLAAEKLKNSNAAEPAAVSFHVVVEVSLPNLPQQAFLNDSVDENQAAFVPVTKMQDVQLLLQCCSVRLVASSKCHHTFAPCRSGQTSGHAKQF